MNGFFQRFEAAADRYMMIGLLMGLPAAVGAVILASI